MVVGLRCVLGFTAGNTEISPIKKEHDEYIPDGTDSGHFSIKNHRFSTASRISVKICYISEICPRNTELLSCDYLFIDILFI